MNFKLIKIFTFSRFITPSLLSFFIITLNQGYLSTMRILHLHSVGSTTLSIGLISTAYYIGSLGCFSLKFFVAQLNHTIIIILFSIFMSIISILLGILSSTWSWIFLNVLAGFFATGLCVVIESWLLASSSHTTRGQTFGGYMAILYTASILGQFLTGIGNAGTLLPFIIASTLNILGAALLLFVKKIKILTAPSNLKSNYPTLTKNCVISIILCFSSGLFVGTTYALLPLFIVQKTSHTLNVGLFMTLTMTGGALFQYPLGYLSDKINREIIAVFCFIATFVICLLIMFAHTLWIMGILIFLFGGVIFSFYPTGINLAYDYKQEDSIGILQKHAFFSIVGAILGQLMATCIMNYTGPDGLFIHFTFISLLIAVFLISYKKHKAQKRICTIENYPNSITEIN